MSAFRQGDVVAHTKSRHRGTVVKTLGTMYNDTAVLVAWDDPDVGAIDIDFRGAHCSGSWEDPRDLSPSTSSSHDE